MKAVLSLLLIICAQTALSQANIQKTGRLSTRHYKAEKPNGLYQVIEHFRTAIIHHKDEKEFASLFLNDHITWATIYTGRTKAVLLRRKPDFKFYSSNFRDFFKLLNAKSEPVEEKFYNVQTSKRSEFATVSFDYSFNVNQQAINWGVEYWSLIKVDDTWKITSVTWTTNLQRFKKCPFKAENEFVYNKSKK